MPASDRPRGIDHVGITVPDIEAATRFLHDAFDAEVLYDVHSPAEIPNQGDAVERRMGIPQGAKVRHIRLLRIGNGPSIELFRFEDTEQDDPGRANDLGLTHVALYVDDIDAAIRRFTRAGGSMLSDAHYLPNHERGPNNRFVYARSPWGTLFELISYPDGISYRDDTRARRWTPVR